MDDPRTWVLLIHHLVNSSAEVDVLQGLAVWLIGEGSIGVYFAKYISAFSRFEITIVALPLATIPSWLAYRQIYNRD